MLLNTIFRGELQSRIYSCSIFSICFIIIIIIIIIGRDSSKTAEIFKNSATFLILTNMFRRYIRHRQRDGYESLQLIKRAC